MADTLGTESLISERTGSAKAGQEAPGATRWLASVEIKADRIRARRVLVNAQASAAGKTVRSRRGAVSEFTRATRSRLIERCHEIAGLESFLTLTYPAGIAPTSSKAVDQHWERLRRWMRQHPGGNVYGVGVRE